MLDECKQCKHWSDAAFCGVWSESTLFAQVRLSQNLGYYATLQSALDKGDRDMGFEATYKIRELWLFGPAQAKRCLPICAKCTDSDYSRAWTMSHPGICYQFLHSIVSNDSVSGQQRPRSDCACMQSDMGLRCPYMLWRHIVAWKASF